MKKQPSNCTKRHDLVQKYLERIAATGLYGSTVAEVAEHFVREGVVREMRRNSPTRTVHDSADRAAFGLLCQKWCAKGPLS